MVKVNYQREIVTFSLKLAVSSYKEVNVLKHKKIVSLKHIEIGKTTIKLTKFPKD